ncbi:hypothetical protein C1J03_23530 (plasmid) [Sulfitobacter sp. SK012]|uniref:hypothetical protein n=1 Tax=Sulfitobacter sp. SK012 TaxID=1389005 RepID=UPI000E0BA5A8|nr:hypothetical protein [Sulfitobacter sp. SK012]AXI49095.1 hypothetical protein C1J03_23530 [Sulfitobacter sp. SK012]
MATKTELGAELELLRAQNEALRSEVRESPEKNMADGSRNETDAMDSLKQLLDEHGIDGENLDALRTQLTDEFTKLQKEYPIAILLSSFAFGFVAGRTFK